MSRFKRFLLLPALTWVTLGQTASLMMDPDVRRVGSKLACLCGRCKNTVGDCQMLGCSYAGGSRQKIVDMKRAGVADEAVVAKFVEEGGLKTLAVPPASGGYSIAWIMPFAMLAVGLYAIYVWVRRMRESQQEPAVVSARHRELAGKDLDALD
ncbi:MAG: cytochrome c-type biogenesis protein CcmH [Bryobacteraceae bacterium]|nr:cytochrome c-type biogenesis protein CcmH [Bryobacteraceae bacterium]